MFVLSARNVPRLFEFGQSSGPSVLDLLGRIRDPDDRVDVESIQQSRSARLGCDHPDRELLFSLQSRGAARLVADSDADTFG